MILSYLCCCSPPVLCITEFKLLEVPNMHCNRQMDRSMGHSGKGQRHRLDKLKSRYTRGRAKLEKKKYLPLPVYSKFLNLMSVTLPYLINYSFCFSCFYLVYSFETALHIAQASLTPNLSLLSPPPQYWDYRCVPSFSVLCSTEN